jgi:two-component system, NtrC family, sensor kinase
MKDIHKLLKRQLKKYTGTEEVPIQFEELFYAVNRAYEGFDNDRSLLERSIEISSKDYTESLEKIGKLQSQLIHQEKMAGIGQLSAGIAHEVNNPLGFISSNMETLKKYISKFMQMSEIQKRIIEKSESGDYHNCCEDIKEMNEFWKKNKLNFVYIDIEDIVNESINGLSRIGTIVKSLLGFSRNGIGTEYCEYDLNKGLKDTITVAFNEIKYSADIEEDLEILPLAFAIGGDINQVILNLIINAVYAIKQTGKKGILKIHTYSNEDSVFCEIADNGIGISKDKLVRIFDPFYTSKPIGEGTGLGLSIAYDVITNKHYGEIKVDSEVGVGTTFTIRIPIKPKASCDDGE